jgi:hypothetical protein
MLIQWSVEGAWPVEGVDTVAKQVGPIREGITFEAFQPTALRWQVWAIAKVPASRHRDAPGCQHVSKADLIVMSIAQYFTVRTAGRGVQLRARQVSLSDWARDIGASSFKLQR